MNATSMAARKVDDRSRLNATVEARVTPLGLAGVTRRLESMQISGTVIHDNYFTSRQRALPNLGFGLLEARTANL